MSDGAAMAAYGWRRGTAAALLAVAVGIGLSRFAYSPLIPVLIEEDWFTPSQAGYLGAANLAGYLLGAVLGLISARWRVARVLRGHMLLASIAFFACATPLSFGWFFGWRLLAGVAGGVLMVLAPPTVLARVPETKRGLAAGLIFSGVGSGIVLSGTLVPALVSAGPATTWIVLGVLSLAATACAWSWWPAIEASPGAGLLRIDRLDVGFLLQPRLTQAYVAYGLVAAGLVPHMVFLVDYIARGLGDGLDAGGAYWVIFGVGALIGPVLAGRIADRTGFLRALQWALVGQVVWVGMLVFAEHRALIAMSSLVSGAALTGTVTLALGRTQELTVSLRDRRAAWTIATIVFAVGQAAGGYGYSFVFAASGESYRLLFALGASALAVALAVAWLPVGRAPGRRAV